MFEDIIGKKPVRQGFVLNKDSAKIKEKCASCGYGSKLQSITGNGGTFCAIAAGTECAHNKEEPFKRWKPKNG